MKRKILGAPFTGLPGWHRNREEQTNKAEAGQTEGPHVTLWLPQVRSCTSLFQFLRNCSSLPGLVVSPHGEVLETQSTNGPIHIKHLKLPSPKEVLNKCQYKLAVM